MIENTIQSKTIHHTAYESKGYHKIIGIVLIILFFVITNLAKYIWPEKIDYPRNCQFFTLFIVHELIFMISNSYVLFFINLNRLSLKNTKFMIANGHGKKIKKNG